MAAWRGSIDNVRLLLDVGCDVSPKSRYDMPHSRLTLRFSTDVQIDRVATGEFTYGKSAIFFAITQCRDDVVLELLARGASCRIINNKVWRNKKYYVTL
jgi:hypothetical protein